MAGPRRDMSDDLDAWVMRLRRQGPEAPKKRPPGAKSGAVGVRAYGEGLWVAFVWHEGRSVYVGIYATVAEAVAARAEKKRELKEGKV